jgi:hypothetical protein
MTTMTYPIPRTNPSIRRGTQNTALILHIGTFADGQRAVPLTASCSAEIGSFADAQRR